MNSRLRRARSSSKAATVAGTGRAQAARIFAASQSCTILSPRPSSTRSAEARPGTFVNESIPCSATITSPSVRKGMSCAFMKSQKTLVEKRLPSLPASITTTGFSRPPSSSSFFRLRAQPGTNMFCIRRAWQSQISPWPSLQRARPPLPKTSQPSLFRIGCQRTPSHSTFSSPSWPAGSKSLPSPAFSIFGRWGSQSSG